MSDIDLRLEKLTDVLKKSLKAVEIKKTKESNKTVLNLWPSHTLKEILANPLFYKQAITPPSPMTSAQFFNSLKSAKVPLEIIDQLALVNVDFRGFNDLIYQGQTIVHKDLAHSIKRVFERIIEETDFPVTGVFPSIRFNWKASRYNVCEAFDWRFVENTKEISDHAFGAAIDINRLLNPWVRKGKLNTPNRPYNPRKRGALHANSKVVRIFKEEGWKWGGDWKISKDRMHFYRPEIPHKYYGKIEAKE